jgi:hypothetical protein
MAEHVVMTSYAMAVRDKMLQSKAPPELLHGFDRQDIEHQLEKILTNHRSLLSHVGALIKMWDKDAPFATKDRQNEIVDKVFNSGLQSLKEAELARLTIDPLLLISVSNKLEESGSEHWNSVKERLNVPIFGKKRKHTQLASA